MSLRRHGILTKSAISLVLLLASGCKGAPPKVDVALWAGDSATSSVKGDEPGKQIKCSEPKFDGYVCMSYADQRKLFNLFWSCEKWPANLPKMTNQDVKKAIDLYSAISKKADQKGKMTQ